MVKETKHISKSEAVEAVDEKKEIKDSLTAKKRWNWLYPR